MPTMAWLSLSVPALLLAASVTGCSSTGSSEDDPTVQKVRAERQESITKAEQEDAAISNKRGKPSAPAKSIKGRLKGGAGAP
jgi:hypothetical protein